MKALSRLLLAGVALAVLLMPLAIMADQLPLPLEKKLPPGVTVVTYFGESLRFTTPVALVVRFDAVSDTQIRLTVRTYGSAPSGPQGASSSEVSIFWEDWNNQVYTGPAPNEPWVGLLLTESGFTEK